MRSKHAPKIRTWLTKNENIVNSLSHVITNKTFALRTRTSFVRYKNAANSIIDYFS